MLTDMPQRPSRSLRKPPRKGSAMKPVIKEIALTQGIKADTLKKWKKRGRVPYRLWTTYLREAKERGKRLSERDLEWSKAA